MHHWKLSGDDVLLNRAGCHSQAISCRLFLACDLAEFEGSLCGILGGQVVTVKGFRTVDQFRHLS